jgi:AcrR family transcriptional regulator
MGSRHGSAPAESARGASRPSFTDVDGSPQGRVLEMQRSRLLSAAVAAVEEQGYTRTTVAHITARARVSRRTFYDLFANREECLLAVLEAAVAQVTDELAAAQVNALPWRERLRTALWRILCFCDREPALARLCVVQSVRAGDRVLERREELLVALARAVDQGRHESPRAGECPPLVAEGIVGAACSILYTRLLKREREPLGELLGELMGLIVLPYLGSAAARRERTRPVPALPAREGTGHFAGLARGPLAERTGDFPMRLTYRTARVLEDLAENPGASNRAVAEHVGIADQGQASKLLARLARLGLLVNAGEGHTKGEPNAWQLTPQGLKVTQSIRGDGRYPQQAA